MIDSDRWRAFVESLTFEEKLKLLDAAVGYRPAYPADVRAIMVRFHEGGHSMTIVELCNAVDTAEKAYKRSDAASALATWTAYVTAKESMLKEIRAVMKIMATDPSLRRLDGCDFGVCTLTYYNTWKDLRGGLQ